MFKKNVNVNITNIMLSSLSNTPPWPGIKLEKSFTLNLLFIAEKNKSPNCPTTLKSNTTEEITNTDALGSITVR